MNRRVASSLLILGGALALVALRDFLFINLNYQIDFMASDRAYSYAHSRFQQAVAGMDLGGLTALKWGLAAFFIAANLALAVLLARARVGDHRYRKFLVSGFVLVAALALVLHFGSPVAPVLRPISIMLLHTLQYPVILLFVWLATREADR